MARKYKKIQDILSNQKNIRFADLDSVLLDIGYEKRQSGKGSSHYIYCHSEIDTIIVLVSHGKNDILPEYQVKKAIQSIKKLFEE